MQPVVTTAKAVYC